MSDRRLATLLAIEEEIKLLRSTSFSSVEMLSHSRGIISGMATIMLHTSLIGQDEFDAFMQQADDAQGDQLEQFKELKKLVARN